MPERPRRPDLDERFSLFPDDAEDVLRRLMNAEDPPLDENDASEDQTDHL